MNILHIATHLGDGAGKAIGGLAILGSHFGEHTHRILLLDKPVKLNHIERCQSNGIKILERTMIEEAISAADVVVLSWWGGAVMDSFLADFPEIPCRVLLWSHKNGYFDPPFPVGFADSFDGFLATTPFTLENPDWCKNSTLVYGFGDFIPEEMSVKTNYNLNGDSFIVGYVGMPGYKRLPLDSMNYFSEVIRLIPNVRFMMAGETSDEFRYDIERCGFEKHFDLLGWCSDIPSLLFKFDVFGYLMRPDTSATTENSVIEAMAAALPCVISKRPIGKYLIDDTFSGILVDSPTEYGRVMAKLYADDNLRRNIGKAGREYTMRNYQTSDNMKRFNDICENTVLVTKYIHRF